MKIANVKGGYDFLPQEEKIRNYIKETLKEVFELYGYFPIETPIITYYDILTDKYDDENDLLKEIYKLSDQGDRKLGLRYDLTVPFAKFIALNKNKIKFPFKRYEIAKVFRDGPVKTGRDREFTQCDVDVVGLDGQFVEAELLCLYKNAFERLGIDIVIKYNSRKLMTGLMIENNVSDDMISTITTIIDKKDKLSVKEFENLMLKYGMKKENIDSLISTFSLSLDELNGKYLNSDNKLISDGLKELNELNNYIINLGLQEICSFSSSLARGQNYYTGNVFEVYEKNNKILGSIGGGGRYDNMITNFIADGNSYPTVGVSFGLSSIYELLKNEQKLNNQVSIDIFVISMNKHIESLKIASQLRNLGYKVEVDTSNKKVKKLFEYANKENIKYVIVLGEDELKNKKIKIKDMFNRCEYEVNVDEISKINDLRKDDYTKLK